MTLQGTENISGFFEGISAWNAAYRHNVLSFFGIDTGGTIALCGARLRLSTARQPGKPNFRSGDFVAGKISLSRLGCKPQDLAERIARGEVVELPGFGSARIGTTEATDIFVSPPDTLHPAGLSTGRRLGVLSIFGGTNPVAGPRPEIDWVLKAASTPFDGVAELVSEYDVPFEQRCKFEVVANTPVEVFIGSKVSGSSAEIAILLPSALRRSNARLSYRIFEKGRVLERGMRSGRGIKWKRAEGTPGILIGTTQLTVPVSAVVNCAAVYADQSHHSYWVGDPKRFQNPRLSAFETIDPERQILRSYLLPAGPKGSAASQFEWAVCCMLWAYGLAPVPLGLADQSRDGPDILAFAPGGGILVVECTIGLLKVENKLAKVARRALLVRERLVSSRPPGGPEVLPVLVTALARQEVQVELDGAVDSGVLVLTREDLEAGLTQTVVFPDGDRTFRVAGEMLERRKAELAARRTSVGQGTLFPD